MANIKAQDLGLREKVIILSYQNITGIEIGSISEIPVSVLSYLQEIGHNNLLKPLILSDIRRLKGKQGYPTIAKRWRVKNDVVRNLGSKYGLYKR